MATTPPILSAVSSSSRQLLLLLRCISFAKKAQVRISADGIRFSTADGSIMEAFIFLEKALFTSYTYTPPSQDEGSPPFEINLTSLLETLNIFGLSDPAASSSKRPGGSEYSHDSFAAHRLNRHAGINAFNNPTLGLSGICTFTYTSHGSPLGIHMAEAGVTTTCDLTTYDAEITEEIPFARDALALKTILRASTLLDAVNELSSLNPDVLTIHASPHRSGANLSLAASGALGSANVDFTTHTSSDTPVLETFTCAARTTSRFKFALIKSAQRAMASASKVSLRLDEEGVLSLQFLVEVEAAGVPVSGGGGGSGAAGAEGVAFVDFRVVPLVEEEDGGDETDDD